MCPVDEYTDPAIREEMFWHAFEEALADRGWLRIARRWTFHMPPCEVAKRFSPPLGEARSLTMPGLVGTWRASTDEHLGEEASGLVDLTCTLTPA